MQPLRRFGMDGAILFSDILVIPQALGQKLDFVAGEGPRLEALESRADIEALSYDRHFLEPVYETVSNVREALKAEGFEKAALIGFAGAPWTVACYMIQGRGSKDFAAVKHFSQENPEDFEALLDILAEATAIYLASQVRAGAEALQLFDSWAGLLNAEEFRKFVIGPTQKIVARLHETCPGTPIIGFPRGVSGENYRAYARQTGIQALGLDHSVDTLWAAENLQSFCPVQGNLDPALLLKGGEEMERQAEKIMDDFADGPHIFNLGHGIDKATPIEHVERLVGIIKERQA